MDYAEVKGAPIFVEVVHEAFGAGGEGVAEFGGGEGLTRAVRMS